MSLDKLK